MSAVLAPFASLRALARNIPRASPSLSSHFSTSSIRNDKEEPEQNAVMSPIVDALNIAAEEKDASFSQRDGSKPEVKPVPMFYPIKPRDLSQKYRTTFRKNTTRPRAVAPTSSESKKGDVFHLLDIDPLLFATNPNILSAYVSEMGMVYPRKSTTLTAKNHRAVSRAIRRARMMGVVPILSRPNPSRRK